MKKSYIKKNNCLRILPVPWDVDRRSLGGRQNKTVLVRWRPQLLTELSVGKDTGPHLSSLTCRETTTDRDIYYFVFICCCDVITVITVFSLWRKISVFSKLAAECIFFKAELFTVWCLSHVEWSSPGQCYPSVHRRSHFTDIVEAACRQMCWNPWLHLCWSSIPQIKQQTITTDIMDSTPQWVFFLIL